MLFRSPFVGMTNYTNYTTDINAFLQPETLCEFGQRNKNNYIWKQYIKGNTQCPISNLMYMNFDFINTFHDLKTSKNQDYENLTKISEYATTIDK